MKYEENSRWKQNGHATGGGFPPPPLLSVSDEAEMNELFGKIETIKDAVMWGKWEHKRVERMKKKTKHRENQKHNFARAALFDPLLSAQHNAIS